MGNIFSIRRNFNTHGKENYVRFGKAIVGIGTCIIQEVLDTYVPSSNIAAAVLGNTYLRIKLTPKQILLISQAAVAGYKDFDITLCYTLLRNVKVPNKPRFPAPTRGWGNQPLATDTSLSDDIERLRILRNEMFCHLPQPSIPIVQFREIWTQLADICSRFKVLYPNSKDFCQELRKLELCNVTRVQWSSLVTLVDQCREHDKALKDHANRLDALDSRQQYLENEQRTLDQSLQSASAHIDTLDDTIQRHSDAIAFLNNGVLVHDLQIQEHTRRLRRLDNKLHYQQEEMVELREAIRPPTVKSESNPSTLRATFIERNSKLTNINKCPILKKQEEEEVPFELSFASVYIRENPKHKEKIGNYRNYSYMDDSQIWSFQEIDKRIPFYRLPRHDGDERNVTDPSNIFEIDGEVARNIYLLGDAAHGKTSFCSWVYKKWSKVKQGDEQESLELDKWETTLQEFDFVFLLHLRSVSPNLTSVTDMIIEDVFEKDEELSIAVKEVLSSNKYRSLVIMDGLDEWIPTEEVKKQLYCKGVPNIHVSKRMSCLISMRPCVLPTIWKVIKISDRVIDIQGPHRIMEIIRYELFNRFELQKNSLEYPNLINRIEHNVQSIAHAMYHPLLASLCLQIWHDWKNRYYSMTSFYAVMIDMLIERAYQRHELEVENDKITDLYNLPAIFTGTVHIGKYFPILLKLGELHKNILTRTLLENELSLSEIHFLLKVGLITQNSTSNHISKDEKVYFLNKSIEDFVIALNIVTEKEVSDAFCTNLSTLAANDIMNLSNVIMLVCGMCPSLGNTISHHVTSVIDSNQKICSYRKSFDKYARYDQVNKWYTPQLTWYRELQYEHKSSPVAFQLSDVHICTLFVPKCDKETIRLTGDLLCDDNVEIKSLCLDRVPTDAQSGIPDTVLNAYLCDTGKTRSLVMLCIACSMDNIRSLKTISIPTLIFLNLENVKSYEDGGCSPLIKGVKKLRSLELMSISFCHGEVGLSCDMNQIELITLKDVHFSAVGWETFLSSLRTIQHTFNVSMFGSDIDEKMYMDIRSSVDFCKKNFYTSHILQFTRVFRATGYSHDSFNRQWSAFSSN